MSAGGSGAASLDELTLRKVNDFVDDDLLSCFLCAQPHASHRSAVSHTSHCATETRKCLLIVLTGAAGENAVAQPGWESPAVNPLKVTNGAHDDIYRLTRSPAHTNLLASAPPLIFPPPPAPPLTCSWIRAGYSAASQHGAFAGLSPSGGWRPTRERNAQRRWCQPRVAARGQPRRSRWRRRGGRSWSWGGEALVSSKMPPPPKMDDAVNSDDDGDGDEELRGIKELDDEDIDELGKLSASGATLTKEQKLTQRMQRKAESARVARLRRRSMSPVSRIRSKS